VLLLSIGAIAFSVAPAATDPDRASALPLRTGVSGLDDFEPTAFERIKSAGSRYVRIWVNWADTAPSKLPASWQPENPTDPAYDWLETDKAVTGAVAAGLVPVLMIEETPPWAERCAQGDNCNPDPTALAQFGTAAARRYSGAFGGLPYVRYWQGLNEPNLSLYFNPQFEGDRPVSAGLYRTLVNSFYAAVKAVNPSNVVIAGGLGPIAVPGLTIGPIQFTKELLCMKGRKQFRPAPGNCEGGVNFDIFDIHPYTTGGPTHKGGINDVELGDLPKMRSLLDAADRAHRINTSFKSTPLWVEEFSWDSNPPDPGGLAMGIETRWVAEALYQAWRAEVAAFFWFSLRDGRHLAIPFSETLQSGLYFRGETLAQDTPKSYLYAFRFPFVSYPQRDGLYAWGRTPTSGPGKVSIQTWTGSRWRQAFVLRAKKSGIFEGEISSRYGRKKKGSVRAVYRGQSSPGFSMRPIKDFYQPPFG
jgi:hypothetical protein